MLVTDQKPATALHVVNCIYHLTQCLQAMTNVANHAALNKKVYTFDVAESASAASVSGTVTLARDCFGSSISVSQYHIHQSQCSRQQL